MYICKTLKFIAEYFSLLAKNDYTLDIFKFQSVLEKFILGGGGFYNVFFSYFLRIFHETLQCFWKHKKVGFTCWRDFSLFSRILFSFWMIKG